MYSHILSVDDLQARVIEERVLNLSLTSVVNGSREIHMTVLVLERDNILFRVLSLYFQQPVHDTC